MINRTNSKIAVCGKSATEQQVRCIAGARRKKLGWIGEDVGGQVVGQTLKESEESSWADIDIGW